MCPAVHPAYQLDEASKKCLYLGTLATQEFHPLDRMMPKVGIAITYKDGAPCSHNRTREVTYEFRCDIRGHSIPLGVEERDTCKYFVRWPSPKGNTSRLTFDYDKVVLTSATLMKSISRRWEAVWSE